MIWKNKEEIGTRHWPLLILYRSGITHRSFLPVRKTFPEIIQANIKCGEVRMLSVFTKLFGRKFCLHTKYSPII